MSQYIPQDWPFANSHSSNQENRNGSVTVIFLGNNCTKKCIRMFKGLKKGLANKREFVSVKLKHRRAQVENLFHLS